MLVINMRYFLALALWLVACTTCQAFMLIAGRSGGADTIVPHVSSATVNATTLVIIFDESVSQGAGYADADIDVDCSTTGANLAVTYVSGNGTSSHTYTMASPAINGETCDLDFTGDADSLEDAAGNDLAAIVSGTITNNTPAPGDSCTGTLIASWHMETDDVTTGTPAGCSTEDTTPTYQSGAARTTSRFYDGSSAINGDGTSARTDFSTAANLVANMKVSFVAYSGTFSSGATAWAALKDASNKVVVSIAGSGTDLRWGITHTGGGVGDSCFIPVGSGRTDDEWVYVETGVIEETAVGADIYVKVCDADGVTNCVTQEEDDDPAASTGTLSVWSWGANTATFLFADGYIDNGKVYNASGY